MDGDRSRYGLLSAALGAVLLAVGVFLPWYGVSLTSSGAAATVNVGDRLVATYGSPALQSRLGELHTGIDSLVGHQLTSLTGHQALEYMSVVLLVLAALALLDALLPLARAGALPSGAGGSLALLGLVASLCVVGRMAFPPAPAGEMLALSLRGGAWMSLLGALLMVAGGLWPRVRESADAIEERVEDALAALSGWTPQS
jgi:hypothetical protein